MELWFEPRGAVDAAILPVVGTGFPFVGLVFAHGMRVARDPIVDPDAPNPAHGVIVGSRQDAADNFNGGLTKGEYAKVSRLARIIVYAPGAAG